MKLYHYTSVENLALILKSGKIRFSRLDTVDDNEESGIYEESVPMGKYTFVSCWTDLKEESIPLWKMYTPQARGVRICLDQDMFNKVVWPPGRYGPLEVEGNIVSIFPPEEFCTPEYVVLYEGYTNPYFYRKIEYVEDLSKVASSAIFYTLEDGKPHLNVNTGEVGKYKHKRWSFQEEVRFALTIVPMLINPRNGDLDIIRGIQDGIPVPISYFDVKLSPEALRNMELVIGPCCTDADRVIIDSLIKNLNPECKILDSQLSAKLKR